MAYISYIILGIILMAGIGIWILLRFLKKRKKKKINPFAIPKETLELFDEIEKNYKNHIDSKPKEGELKDPFEIMWETIRHKYMKGGSNNGREINNRTGTSPVQTDGISKEPNRFQPLPNVGDEQIKERIEFNNRRIQPID